MTSASDRLALRLDANKSVTDMLTCVTDSINTPSIVRARDVLMQMRDAAIADSKRLAELAAERTALAEAHRKYVANLQVAHLTAESLRSIQAFVGSQRFEQWVNAQDSNPALWMETDLSGPNDELRQRTALWEHIASVLQFMPEPRVSDVLNVLKDVGISATRPAVESAIKAHPKLFGVRRRGGDRVVFLKDSPMREEMATPIRPTRRRT